jgi:hypothetical protein
MLVPGMIASIDESQLPECGVVGAGAVLRGGGAGALVVRIVGHQVAPMHVGRHLRMPRMTFNKSLNYKGAGALVVGIVGHQVPAMHVSRHLRGMIFNACLKLQSLFYLCGAGALVVRIVGHQVPSVHVGRHLRMRPCAK